MKLLELAYPRYLHVVLFSFSVSLYFSFFLSVFWGACGVYESDISGRVEGNCPTEIGNNNRPLIYGSLLVCVTQETSGLCAL